MIYKTVLMALLFVVALVALDNSYQFGWLGNVIYGPIENHGCQ